MAVTDMATAHASIVFLVMVFLQVLDRPNSVIWAYAHTISKLIIDFLNLAWICASREPSRPIFMAQQ
jgi:hypothetical protein